MTVMTRLLKFRDPARRAVIPIRMFQPEQDKGAWSCRWEIEWPDRRRTNTARGADAIQSLVHALQMIGAEIYSSEEHQSGNLTWGEKWTGYGFPVPNNIRDSLIGDDAKYL